MQIITASTPEASKALYQEMLTTAQSMGVDKLDNWVDSKYAEKRLHMMKSKISGLTIDT